MQRSLFSYTAFLLCFGIVVCKNETLTFQGSNGFTTMKIVIDAAIDIQYKDKPRSLALYFTDSKEGDDSSPDLHTITVKDYRSASLFEHVTFQFKKTNNIVSMQMGIAYRDPNTGKPIDTTATSDWIQVSHLDKSYSCDQKQSIKMGEKVTASIRFIQAQAFEMKKGQFGASDGCDAFVTSAKPTTTTTATTKTTPTTKTTRTTPTTKTTKTTPTPTSTTTKTTPTTKTTKTTPTTKTTKTTPTTTTTKTTPTTTTTKTTPTTTTTKTTPTTKTTKTTPTTKTTKTTPTTKTTKTTPTTKTTKTTPTTKTTKTTPTTKTTKTTPTTKTTKTSPKSTPTTVMTTTPHMVDNNFTITDKNKTVCLVLRAGISLNLNYMVGNKSKSLKVNTNSNDKVDTSGSTCSNTTDTLRLRWEDSMNLTTAIDLEMAFTKSKEGNFSMSSVKVSYSIAVNKTLSFNGSSSALNLTEFNTKVGDYYDCSNKTTVKFTNGTSMEIRDLLVQAFREHNTTELYGSKHDCYYHKPGSSTSAVVPIAVGIALAAMVVIVLIGYCIGRRRARTAGYESMS